MDVIASRILAYMAITIFSLGIFGFVLDVTHSPPKKTYDMYFTECMAEASKWIHEPTYVLMYNCSAIAFNACTIKGCAKER